MSIVDERIAMLEALLARIRRRSHEPRDGGMPKENGVVFHDAISAAPPTVPEPEPPPVRQPEPSQVRAIDAHLAPPMEVVELDLEPDPSMPPPPMPLDETAEDDAFESRSRLVTAAPVMMSASSEPTIEVSEPLDLPIEEPLVAAEEVPVSTKLVHEEEEEDSAPSSSRRPIRVEEKLAQLAEEDDELHAPPPESGKLLAAPVIDLAEPGVPAALLPEVARATPPDAQVAAFVGKVPEARIATFGDLLDSTMRL